MKDNVTSYETSRELAKVGVNLFRHKFEWLEGILLDYYIATIPEVMVVLEKDPYRKHYPAYLLSELLEMVEGDWCMQSDKRKDLGLHTCLFDLLEQSCDLFLGNSLIEAIAQAILWQKEHGK